MLTLGFFLCTLLVAMDCMGGILAIEAQIKFNKSDISRRRDANMEALKLGCIAAALFASAHIAAHLLGGYIFVISASKSQRSSSSRRSSFASLILSWITVAAGFPMLLIGTLEISKSGSCAVQRDPGSPNFLAGGGILCFVHALFCSTFYMCAALSMRKDDTMTDIATEHT